MRTVLTLLALVLAGPLLRAQYTITSWTTADGLPSDDVRDVAVGPDGTIWLATSAGVAAFDGTTFTVHTTATHPGLPSNDLYAIGVMNNGDVWVGSDFGLSRLDDTDYITYTTADGLSDNEIKSIKQAPSGEIWVATLNGASRFDGNTFTAFGSPNIPFGGALHVAFGSDGTVYLSGGLGGVIVYDGSTFSTITNADGLLSNRIRGIAVNDAQQKWVGTAEGISVLNANDEHVADHPNAFILPPPDELNPITDMLVDDAGRVWAGVYVDYLVTVGGVSIYANGAWSQIEESDGLAGPNVRRLALGGDGSVWVSTSTGLSRISNISIGVEERGATTFTLFPSPASATVQLRAMEPFIAAQMELCDAAGRIVLRQQVSGTMATLDVSGLPNGTYSVRVGDRVQRLVVAH
jgi:ligand-binding sensor domain-containing protein